MIVCICRAKSDRDVQAAIEEGACSIADLRECGIGTECGSCHPLLRTMLAAARLRDQAEPAAVTVAQPGDASSSTLSAV